MRWCRPPQTRSRQRPQPAGDRRRSVSFCSWSVHDLPARCRHRAVARLSRHRTRWAARNPRSIDCGDARRQYYTYGTGAGLPILVSDDGWTWRRAGTLMQALPGGRPGADVIARGGNNTWAPDVIRVGEKSSTTPRRQPNRRSAFWSAGRSIRTPGLQMGRRRSGRLVRRRRGQQCHRPGRVSIPRPVRSGSPRSLLRLHPPRRVESEDRETSVSRAKAGRHRHQLRSVDHDLPRGLHYLLVTHGSCCAGANSSYNIRMGRPGK